MSEKNKEQDKGVLLNIIEAIKNNKPLFLYDSLNVVPGPRTYFEKYADFHQIGEPILKDDSLISLLIERLNIPESKPKIVYDSRKIIQGLPFKQKMFPEPLTDDQINLIYMTEVRIPSTNLKWVEFRIDLPFAGLKRIVTSLR